MYIHSLKTVILLSEEFLKLTPEEKENKLYSPHTNEDDNVFLERIKMCFFENVNSFLTQHFLYCGINQNTNEFEFNYTDKSLFRFEIREPLLSRLFGLNDKSLINSIFKKENVNTLQSMMNFNNESQRFAEKLNWLIGNKKANLVSFYFDLNDKSIVMRCNFELEGGSSTFYSIFYKWIKNIRELYIQNLNFNLKQIVKYIKKQIENDEIEVDKSIGGYRVSDIHFDYIKNLLEQPDKMFTISNICGFLNINKIKELNNVLSQEKDIIPYYSLSVFDHDLESGGYLILM